MGPLARLLAAEVPFGMGEGDPTNVTPDPERAEGLAQCAEAVGIRRGRDRPWREFKSGGRSAANQLICLQRWHGVTQQQNRRTTIRPG
jgi:hypothetical protein